jgi:hypothetical protein
MSKKLELNKTKKIMNKIIETFHSDAHVAKSDSEWVMTETLTILVRATMNHHLNLMENLE